MTRAEFLRFLGVAASTRFLPFPNAGNAEPRRRSLPPLEKRFGTAFVRAEGDILVVSTGQIERRWRHTSAGLVTISLRKAGTSRNWARPQSEISCDWAHAGWLTGDTEARIVSINAERSDDEGFTAPHMAVTVELIYPALLLSLRYVIWSYPGAEGLRTQLWLKGPGPVPNSQPEPTPAVKRADYLPVAELPAGLRRRYVGYFNDTQHRDMRETEILREDVRAVPYDQGEVVDWANFVSLESADGGLLMLKESHKCVNQPGVDTGAFVLDTTGLQSTGWGLALEDLDSSRYRWCWGTWVILHDGTDDGRELSLKQFDRLRYPVCPAKGIPSLACTWGDSKSGRNGRDHAAESEVLPEMQSASELGIGMVLIDDGWQVSRAAQSSDPDAGKGWKPNPEIYPNGWDQIVSAKKRLGLEIGLWGVAQEMPLEDMQWNWDRLGMVQLKLDFAKLNRYRELDELMLKVRCFLTYTRHRSSVSWDVTENSPRYGYYWAREYGDVHFMNRKPLTPSNVIYIPWLALRDFWQLARYSNLNKWQLPTCNPAIVDPERSDAQQHSAAYCTATTVMGIPEFMAVTRSYSVQARQEIADLFRHYNEQRASILEEYVFAIGDKPSNAGWTGFQSYRAESRSGHLLIFRERLNKEVAAPIAIRLFSPGTSLTLRNLRTGEVSGHRLEQNHLRLEIQKPGDFLFLAYTVSG